MPRTRAGEESRHGATQPEADRKADKTTLRLLPRTKAALGKQARAKGLDMSAYVSALVMADAAGAVSWPTDGDRR